MTRPHLILQHRQQVSEHIQSLHHQPHALVHLEIAAHSGVDRLELRLRPHELGLVEDGALQVDVDAQNEKLADLLVDAQT